MFGRCTAQVRRFEKCFSDDYDCIQARARTENHGHFHEEVCGTLEADAIPVCFLEQSVRLREMFKSEVECHKQLALWRGIRRYILENARVMDDRPRANLWDGDRVSKELLWFWDPNSVYMLPAFCGECGELNSSKYIMSCVPVNERQHCVDGTFVRLRCRACSKQTDVLIQMVAGNPRNLVYKIHFDGWLPHGIGPRSNRNVSSIELMSGCISATESGKTSHISTMAFVPEVLIPKGPAAAKFMTAVLSVIVDELLDLFVDGIDIDYRKPLPELQGTRYGEVKPERSTVRVILLALIADLPARAKCGGWKDGGKSGCYKCECNSCVVEQGTSAYYYPDFLSQFNNPPKRKDRNYANEVRYSLYFYSLGSIVKVNMAGLTSNEIVSYRSREAKHITGSGCSVTLSF